MVGSLGRCGSFKIGYKTRMTEVRLPSDWVQFLNVREFLVWVDDQGINPDDWDVKTEDGTLDLILSFSREEYATLFKLKFGYGALH